MHNPEQHVGIETLLPSQERNGMTLDGVADEYARRLNRVLKLKWTVGYQDRGMGRGDFAVLVKWKGKELVVVECPSHSIAGHICVLHNLELNMKKAKRS